MRKLIVFELGGVLVNLNVDLAGAANQLRGEQELELLYAKRIIRFQGGSLPRPARLELIDSGITGDQAVMRLKKNYADFITGMATLENQAEKGLRELRLSDNTLILWSTFPGEKCRCMAEKFGIAGYFREIVGGDGDWPTAPAPELLLNLAEKGKFTPDQCWFYGATTAGIAAAKAAHFRIVRRGPGTEKVEFEVNNFEEFVMAVSGF